jgi:putative tricarboxylic transport membrane protein
MTPDGVSGKTVTAGLLALFGAVLLWDAARIPETGGYAGIGPAAMPRLVGGVLIGLAGLTLIGAFRGRLTDVPRQNPAALLWIGGGLAAQIALLHVAGFSVATGVLFATTAAAFGKRNLVVTVPVGIGLAFVTYGIFDRLLPLNLPGGVLETLIWGG